MGCRLNACLSKAGPDGEGHVEVIKDTFDPMGLPPAINKPPFMLIFIYQRYDNTEPGWLARVELGLTSNVAGKAALTRHICRIQGEHLRPGRRWSTWWTPKPSRNPPAPQKKKKELLLADSWAFHSPRPQECVRCYDWTRQSPRCLLSKAARSG